jgi:deoxyribodipyrimidine photolyase-related protein
MAKTLRLILGDQLNQKHSWFENKDDNCLFLMMEMRQETDYVRHHIQKITAFFQSMRRFGDWLEKKGHQLIYLKIGDTSNKQGLSENINAIISKYGADRFEYMLPDEYRLDLQLKKISSELSIETKSFDTEHFLSERMGIKTFFEGKKSFLMESFYRSMRKKYDILMEGNNPTTGKWNYDSENRNKIQADTEIPASKGFKNDVLALVKEINDAGIETVGKIEPDNFQWPCDRKAALDSLNYFCENLLPYFGKYQDAMYSDEPFLFHSKLSFALNVKLLNPLEVISKVENQYKSNPEKYNIAQVEGFIRQVLGWREFMRGVYWAKMPEYEKMNFFHHRNKLPKYFWDGETKMNCMKAAIGQSLSHAYAHHIQRLMVTGNFSLLAGIDPDQVDEWYLGIYIDAIQWVEITNTRGMSQFADGGIVGTKPYVSSANYIDKMSNYCEGCHYDKKKKHGDKACPFNSLYWAFYERNRDKLENNPRIGFVYNTLAKMKEKDIIFQQADKYLSQLDEL